MIWTRRLWAANESSRRTFFAAAFFSLLIPFFSGCAVLEEGREMVGLDRQDVPNAAAALAWYQVFKPSSTDLITTGLMYLVVDPLSPNWRIEETRVGTDTFYLRMTMKRYNNGGEGEAWRVFRRRAEQIQQEFGYDGYHLLEYSEGIDSSFTGAERYGEGRIQMVYRQ
jgi:hypothetical protein